MKIIKKIVQIVVVIVILLVGVPNLAWAEGTLAVSVNAILPENQYNKEVTYYDLRMKPGQKQELDFELTNPTDKDEKIKLEINNGTTNDTGAIDYSNRGESYQRDSSLKLGLTDIATVPEEVVVKANSKETVKIKLDMPEESFSGVLVGAVRVTQSDEAEADSKAKKESGGMQIKNKVAYTVGLNLSETDDEVKAELDLINAFAGQTGGRNVIKGNVQNKEPQVLEEITYEARVTKKGSNDTLHESRAENYRFAPNSNFNFDVSWESQPFKAGDYTYHMKAESKETGQKWEWTKDFKINAEEAKELNKKAIDLDKDNTMLYIMIAIGLLILIILLLLVYIKVKSKKEEKRRKELKKKKRKKGNKKSSKKSNK